MKTSLVLIFVIFSFCSCILFIAALGIAWYIWYGEKDLSYSSENVIADQTTPMTTPPGGQKTPPAGQKTPSGGQKTPSGPAETYKPITNPGNQTGGLKVATEEARKLRNAWIPPSAQTGHANADSYEAYYDAKGRIVWLQKEMELNEAQGVAVKKWTNESLKMHTINKFSIVFDRIQPLVQNILKGAIGDVSAKNMERMFSGPDSLWTDPNAKVIPICQHANVEAKNAQGGRWGGTVRGQFVVITVPYFAEKEDALDFDGEISFMMGNMYHEIGHVCDEPMPHDELFYKKVVNINTLGHSMGITKQEDRNKNLGYGVEFDINGNHLKGVMDPTVLRPV